MDDKRYIHLNPDPLTPKRILFDLDNLPDDITIEYRHETIALTRYEVMYALRYLKQLIETNTTD